jgi:hypothetical protein
LKLKYDCLVSQAFAFKSNLCRYNTAARRGDVGAVADAYKNLAKFFAGTDNPKKAVFFFDKCLDVAAAAGLYKLDLVDPSIFIHLYGPLWTSMDYFYGLFQPLEPDDMRYPGFEPLLFQIQLVPLHRGGGRRGGDGGQREPGRRARVDGQHRAGRRRVRAAGELGGEQRRRRRAARRAHQPRWGCTC